MPASAQHRRITENVLKLVPELPGPRLRLTEEFCLYPDRAMTFPEQLAPYCRLPSGNWFHYLPATTRSTHRDTAAAPVPLPMQIMMPPCRLFSTISTGVPPCSGMEMKRKP